MYLDCMYFTQGEMKKLINSMVILIDTRQKENKHITDYFDAKKIAYKTKSLPFGDYSFMIPKNEELGIPRDLVFYNHITVQRKASLQEISGNLSQERARFEKEAATSPESKVLLIENSTYEDLVNGNYRTDYKPVSFMATLMTFWHRYNFPVFFLKDRRYSGLWLRQFFEYWIKEQLK